MRKILFFAVLVMTVFSFDLVQAQESYANQFNQKFQRGVVNALLSWTKALTVPYEKSAQDPNAWATMGRSIYESVGGTVAGVFNTVFSPTPLKEMAYPGGGVLDR